MTELMKRQGIDSLVEKAKHRQTDVGILNEMVACFKDAVESLQAENAQLQKSNRHLLEQKEKLQAIFDYYVKWKPVSEELPEKSGRYLAEINLGYQVPTSRREVSYSKKCGWGCMGIVVKWLPIPPAPEGETNERKD